MHREDEIRRLNRKLNWTIALVVVCGVGSLIVAINLARPRENSFVAMHKQVITGLVTSAAVSTQELRITDDDGQTMALLSVNEDAGSGQLVLKDASGNRLFEFSGSEDGGALLTMSDSEDRIGAIVNVDSQGRGELLLMNGKGSPSLSLLTLGNAAGGICTADASGNTIAAMGPGAGGAGEVTVGDGAGTMRRVSELFGRKVSDPTAVANEDSAKQ